MKNTRQTIIEALKSSGYASVNDLAEQVKLKAVTIRHHLNSLQADGLVNLEERRQSVGRPYHVYFLTEKAHQLFPHRYHTLVERILDQIKRTLSPEVVQTVMDDLTNNLANQLRGEFEDLSPDERRGHLLEVLGREGFLARWQDNDDGLQLIEYHCPYHLVGQRHPEICQIDEAVIRAVMDQEVEKESCVLTGDVVCTFTLLENI